MKKILIIVIASICAFAEAMEGEQKKKSHVRKTVAKELEELRAQHQELFSILSINQENQQALKNIEDRQKTIQSVGKLLEACAKDTVAMQKQQMDQFFNGVYSVLKQLVDVQNQNAKQLDTRMTSIESTLTNLKLKIDTIDGAVSLLNWQ